MRLFPPLTLLALAAPLVQAGIFGSSDSTSADASTSTTSTTAASSSSSSSSSNGTGSTPAEVTFLQTLQTADINSMSCLITLVNMTYQSVGTCLGLTTLTTLVVSPDQNSSFSDQLTSYIGGICGNTQCSEQDVEDSLSQIDANCQNSINTDLIRVLQAILTRYSSAYYTLACSVHFNGTSTACLPDTLNSSQTANSNSFFDDLVAGTNLTQYQDNVFTSSPCTGCMYEMYKASYPHFEMDLALLVYTIPDIRGNQLTQAFGSHLQNDCPAQFDLGSGRSWNDVLDQQIPDALSVQQSTPTASAAKVGVRRTDLFGVPIAWGSVVAVILVVATILCTGPTP